MVDTEQKRAILVLTAGRSGSSLLMSALQQMGMRLSEDLLPANPSNPRGHFEDRALVELHKRLFQDLNTHPALPLPEGWLQSKAARQALPVLKQSLEDRVVHGEAIWGFKDPRLSVLLPLWLRAMNVLNIVPQFILSVRDPAAVCASLRRQTSRDEAVTEFQWLFRNCEAVFHSGGDCFVLHYEDWFKHPEETWATLLDYTGLGGANKQKSSSALPPGLVESSLNRAEHDDYAIQSGLVKSLYNELKLCHGQDFDRKPLMSAVKDCRGSLAVFSKSLGFSNALMRNDLAKMESQLEASAETSSELETKPNAGSKREGAGPRATPATPHELEKQFKELVEYNRQLLVDNTQLQETLSDELTRSAEDEQLSEQLRNQLSECRGRTSKLEQQVGRQKLQLKEANLRKRKLTTRLDRTENERHACLSDLQRSRKRNRLRDRQLKEIRSSYTFRIGELWVQAVDKPGVNTVALPFRMIALLYSLLSKKSSG